ncbi:MAG: NYN domain-containing protein [Azonexus sp.]|nr:NYN domain-containing protein [Azonexus sp.]MCK6411808.1 NYN domain-containing protein [Azonexus sp.]
MAAANDTASMALFCDFENIALGVRDAQYEKFDIKPVLERLLAKGSIVVKKAYCDWERYKGFKAAMHEANFELIEIPHVRQSGKNSADIRMVVDALDLCYTKAHVDTFVIISGDSDFSPLVSKLRENAKRVIGVGVKQSCSDLLVTNCDEFIYYDDLVREREAQRGGGARREREQGKRSPEEEQKRREKLEERKTRAVELAAMTFADMVADRGENERIWASVLKEVIKRRNPGFNESYFGFRTFGNLLEEAAQRGLLSVGRDEKSGNYVTRAQARPLDSESEAEEVAAMGAAPLLSAEPLTEPSAEGSGRRRGRARGRKGEVSPVENPLSTVDMENEPKTGSALVEESDGEQRAGSMPFFAPPAGPSSGEVAIPEMFGEEGGGRDAGLSAVSLDVVEKPRRTRKPARKEKAGKQTGEARERRGKAADKDAGSEKEAGLGALDDGATADAPVLSPPASPRRSRGRKKAGSEAESEIAGLAASASPPVVEAAGEVIAAEPAVSTRKRNLRPRKTKELAGT